MENKYGNLLSIMLVVAIVVIIAILGFIGYKVYTSDKINKESKDVAADFDENANNPSKPSDNNSSDDEGGYPTLEEILNSFGSGNSDPMYQQSGNKEMYYKGYRVIGTISIPSINVEYPILEENNSETKKIAVVAVYPQNDRANAVNKPGNLVLWAHNYKNGTFFSDIKKLQTGAKIYIKDISGTKLEYQVYNSYETTDSDMSYATRNTEGARELTLSTCSDDSGRRDIVWARETKK